LLSLSVKSLSYSISIFRQKALLKTAFYLKSFENEG
jgi:hypothetical protein